MKNLPVPASVRDLIRFGSGGSLPKYFTKEEVHRILLQATNDRNNMLISLLWRTGARISELLNVKIEDFDSYAKTVKLRTLKRKSKNIFIRIVPLPKDLMNRIDDYIEQKKIISSDRLFNLTRGGAHFIIMNICLKAGIDRKRSHPHTFRHSFAIHATLNRVPPSIIQDWLGHANIANTMIYGKVLTQDSRGFMEDIEW